MSKSKKRGHRSSQNGGANAADSRNVETPASGGNPIHGGDRSRDRRAPAGMHPLLSLSADPPRPKKVFLIVASGLLAAWIAFLVILAAVSGSIRAS